MRIAISVAAVLLVCAGATFATTTYSGSLSAPPPASDDGLLVFGPGWIDKDITISWTVTYCDLDSRPSADHPWLYEYTVTKAGTGQGFSHFLIEVSPGFGEADLYGMTGASWGIGAGGAAGNPGLPSNTDTFIKIQDFTLGTETLRTFSFYSTKDPVWGDFYTKDGKTGGFDNYCYNAGFVLEDPVLPPDDGSVFNHILRPDGGFGEDPPNGAVPEPLTLLAVGTALAGLGAYLRKRKIA
jgi:hypothetical protein